MLAKDDFFSFERKGGLQHVRFYLYKDDRPYKKNRILFPENKIKDPLNRNKFDEYRKLGFIVNTNTACFAGLPTQLGLRKETYSKPDADGCNRIIYFPEIDKNIIEAEHIKKWYEIAKKYKLLPEYFNVEDALENKAVVFDVTAHSLNTLYMYLTIVRCLTEEPSYVKNTLRLNCTYKINFLIALVFACYMSYANMGHHFIPANTPYIKKGSPFDLKDIDISLAVGLYRFIENGGIDENFKIEKGYYRAGQTIRSFYKALTIKVGAKHINSSILPKLIKLSDEEIKNKLKLLKTNLNK